MDISSPNRDILKRWNGEKWVETTIPQNQLDMITNTIANSKSQIEQLSDQISSKVSAEEFRTGLADRAEVDWVNQKLESVADQTAKDITFQFNQSKEYVAEATDPLKTDISEIKSYQRFSVDGLELGMQDSPFKVRLSNERLSFLENGIEIAYVSNNKLHITEARVTEKMAIGTEDNGYFDWITTKNGLGQKWRGPVAG